MTSSMYPNNLKIQNIQCVFCKLLMKKSLKSSKVLKASMIMLVLDMMELKKGKTFCMNLTYPISQ